MSLHASPLVVCWRLFVLMRGRRLACEAAALGGGSCCPPCSPGEIDDDVGPALLHLREGQRRHVAPDFQSFLDGPSYFSFYQLPWEPDNSERQQTLDEESISCCSVNAAVMKTPAVGSCHRGCHPFSAPEHLPSAEALLQHPPPSNM